MLNHVFVEIISCLKVQAGYWSGSQPTCYWQVGNLTSRMYKRETSVSKKESPQTLLLNRLKRDDPTILFYQSNLMFCIAMGCSDLE